MRTRRLVAALAGVLVSAVLALPAAGHHSFAAEFDANQPVTLHGTITRLEWINPHSWLHVDVKNADGTTTPWMIEGATPNTLLRRGFTRDTVKIGTEITIVGYRAKNGANRANGRDLILADGSRLFMGSPDTGAPGGDGEPAAPAEEGAEEQ
jgi:Family of unknown function (DUF6152)